MSWSPSPGVLFNKSELETVSESISLAPLEGTVLGYSYEITPIPAPGDFDFSATASGVSVIANTLTGHFNIALIEYLQIKGKPSSLVRVGSWDDVPPGVDIIQLQPDANNAVTFTLTVTATLSTSEPEIAQYTLTINQDYTANRNILTERITNASSS